ncbi:NUDIX hydrolase domain-like protein [Russula earlei]|uniref:NUDIX hydrolase domain-like protein n=1 Tax=Russula earlei TaxID=71964 RepID=A0ACC0UN27_9AGAM|nr:NUDIX hydrolase domain-like protein [Russula earlei]
MTATAVLVIPDEIIAALSKKSQACIERLRKHKPDLTNECVWRLFLIDRTVWPASGWLGWSPKTVSCFPPLYRHANLYNQPSVNRLAAVLVLLYERAGGLRVLLTTRSKELRSHPGQTALPGGKADEGDAGLVETALREANEEVALPLRSPHVHTLCTLEPFVSQRRLLVTPVIALLDDVSVLEELRAAPREVARIFDHPLEALLEPELARREELAALGGEDWPYETELHNTTDVPWLGGMYRMHRFRTTASPVKGFTADILLATAAIAYAREPVFQRWGEGQLRTFAEVLPAVEAVAALSQPSPPDGHYAPTMTVKA